MRRGAERPWRGIYDQLMRKAGAVVLSIVSLAALLFSYAALRNLWAENPDSPDSLYITVGAIWIGLAAATGLLALYLWRRRRN